MSAANLDIDIAYLKLTGIMPAGDIDLLESQAPGCVDAIAKDVTAQFSSMLRKRYSSIPYPPPFELKSYASHVVVYRLFLRRGFNPKSEQDQLIKSSYDDAIRWLREASDPKGGLVVIGMPADQTEDAVNVGAPLAYGEASPYTWMDKQAEILRQGGQ